MYAGAVVVGLGLSAWSLWRLSRSELDGGQQVGLQFAGTTKKAARLVPRGMEHLFLDAIRLDWFLILGYGIGLAGAFGLGFVFLYRQAARRWALRGLLLTSVPVMADVAENLLLRSALTRLEAHRRNGIPLNGDMDGVLRWAGYSAQLKWAALVPLLLAALWILATLGARRALHPARLTTGEMGRNQPEARKAYEVADQPSSSEGGPDVIVPSTAPHDWEPRPDWVRQASVSNAAQKQVPAQADSALARWRTRAVRLPGREPAELGICVSGGGIRSASVTLGALQALREKGKLAKARYLVSVSGGGYTTGAFQLALTGAGPRFREGQEAEQAHLATPENVFAPGSPEEDHIRRHGKYLADNPAEGFRAAGAVLRGMAVSFGMLALLFAVVGEFLHLFYSAVPMVDLGRFVPAVKVFKPTCEHPAPPDCPGDPKHYLRSLELPPYAGESVLMLLAAAALVAVVGAFVRSFTGESQPAWLRSTVKALVGLALVVAFVTVVLPAVIWFFAWLSHHQSMFARDGVGVSALGAITAAAAALGSVFTAMQSKVKQVKPDGGKAGWFSRGTTLLTNVSGGLVKTVICWLVLLLVAFFGLALMSWCAVYAGGWAAAWRLALPVVLLVLSFVIDQTTFSLHPFYRRRLASAFAVRRAVLRDGSVGALPYDYDAEPTPLSDYAKKVTGFPQVIFVASAALSLRNRTAPGRPAVPFSFASDYVGGPDTGWVRADTMRETAQKLIQRDLTVQSAMAVSGAAFASAMGTQTMFLERLLALSNLRLGTWVPNPLYLAELAARQPSRTMPRLPQVRRLRYQLQELAGRFLDTSPMLLCTDGGHVDNLGLVETLRLRCRTIVVIDSSGDSPPLATTLAQAVTLAYEDLGVKISFDQPGQNVYDLVPGSAEPLSPEEPMAGLNVRFSKECVVRGTIEYPEPIQFSTDTPTTSTGTIIFAKAALTPDMPYKLLSYALEEKVFPRRATFDQWFDHAQFDAYQGLGYVLGTRAANLTP